MNKSLLQRLAMLLATTLIAACASRTPAPVVDRGGASARASTQSVQSAKQSSEYHTVKKGETLYSIALEYGQAYQDVAAWNGIENPNMLKAGQRLRIVPPEGAVLVQPIAGPAPVEVHAIGSVPLANSDKLKHEPKGGKQPYSEKALAIEQQPPASTQAASKGEPANQPSAQESGSSWVWPGKGRVLNMYVEGSGKGIDLEGRVGDPVLAAEAGKVTYAGSGIRGYGNLLIIQHTNGLSSVYAHNSKLLVKEKDTVAKGQKIAEVGDSDADQAMLHFEIRRQGKPLDPLKLLPQR